MMKAMQGDDPQHSVRSRKLTLHLGEAQLIPNAHVPLQRNDHLPDLEESYHTYSYTPLRSELGEIKGLLNRSFECANPRPSRSIADSGHPERLPRSWRSDVCRLFAILFSERVFVGLFQVSIAPTCSYTVGADAVASEIFATQRSIACRSIPSTFHLPCSTPRRSWRRSRK